MSAFRFRLERVLSWRETQLAIEKADLECLRRELRTITTELEELVSRADKETELVQKARSLSGSAIADMAVAWQWLKDERKRLLIRIGDCQSAVAKRSVEVVQAQRNVRLIERLKDRRRNLWAEEENRQLEELAGESAIAGFRRESPTRH